MNGYQYGQPLWSEILPGLWQGGTHDTDTIHERGVSMFQPTQEDFDTVISLAALSNGVGWGVKEHRFAFLDSDMNDFDVTELKELVEIAHRDWKAGKRVLIRCQAGWNRSGLLMALTLIKDGFEPQEAIDLIRERRVPEALSNQVFAKWLVHDADLEFWRGRRAA